MSHWFRTLGKLNHPDGRVEVLRDGQVAHEKKAPPFTQKFRVACEACNTGWMHDLEEAVKTDLSKMVWGDQVFLPSRTQRYLATWLVKTCCVLEHADLTPGKNIHREHFDQLYQRKTRPPDWCQVWLARSTVPKTKAEAHLAAWRCERVVVQANEVTGEDQYWWFGTLRVGAVLMQVHGSRGEHPVHLDRQALGDRVAQLWPVGRHVVTFPPGRTVDVDEILPAALGELTAERIERRSARRR